MSISKQEHASLIEAAAAGDPGEDGEAALEAELIERDDGLLVNSATGEIVGLADVPPTFFVDSRTAAEWVLRQLCEEAAALNSINDQRQAINAQLDKMAGARSRRIGWLHWRFDHELEAFASEDLARSKSASKTWRCPWGEISFRWNRGRNKIIDMAAALGWARSNAPGAIHVQESVLVSEILPFMDPEEAPAWIERTPAGEKATTRAVNEPSMNRA